MSMLSIDSRDVRALKRAIRFEMQRYERSVRYYSDGDGAGSAKAESNISFANERIEELKYCLESLEELSAS